MAAVDQPVTGAQMAGYRAGAARRRQTAERARREHWDRAQRVASEAARILRAEFGATRITLFGSGTALVRFGPSSDLDLAAWGIEEHRYLRALARLLSIDPAVAVDLVAMEQAPPALRAAIETEGREL
jgi:uncharacterized protein